MKENLKLFLHCFFDFLKDAAMVGGLIYLVDGISGTPTNQETFVTVMLVLIGVFLADVISIFYKKR